MPVPALSLQEKLIECLPAVTIGISIPIPLEPEEDEHPPDPTLEQLQQLFPVLKHTLKYPPFIQLLNLLAIRVQQQVLHRVPNSSPFRCYDLLKFQEPLREDH